MNDTGSLQNPEKQANSDSGSLLALNDVRFHWPGRDGFALSVESFSLDYGEKLFLKGPSGSGKSTLLSLICGIVSPDSGSICIDGVDIAQLSASRADRLRADKLGIIFQQFNLLPYGSMLQNVLLPLQFSHARRDRASARGMPTDEARRLLQRLGLAVEQHARGVTRLSIGQQQRVAVARAIIGNPRLIIADEPTSALDADNRDEFLKLLFEEVTRANAGLILVSHDQSLASRFNRRLEISEIASTSLPGAA
ncbi:MAG: ABC transporter ATP-binding protein [Gammaproteobacteria bacterium]|nr:ABC transporter ATP-binding protein [Gammaproteobacteria bacterium]